VEFTLSYSSISFPDGIDAVAAASRGAWLTVLAGGCALVGVAWYLPDGPAAAVWICVQLAVMAIATDALTRRAAVHRSGWWVLLTSSAVGVGSGALYLVPAEELSEWAWVVALAARYALLIVGVTMLLGFRRAQTAEQTFLDAGIVCAGLAIVGWTFLVEPSLNDSARTHPGVTFSFVALDLLMLACLVRITLGAHDHTPSMFLLAAAGAVVIAADVLTFTRPDAGLSAYQPQGIVHLAWQMSGVLLAAAALHPSFGEGYAAAEPDGPAGDVPVVRFAVFTAVALIAPIAPVLGLLYAGHDVSPALAGSTGLTAVLVVLLVVRLGLVARLAGRRARAMNLQAATLVVQSTALQQALEEQQELQRQLTHRALHDPLTGLANRVLLIERLEKALLATTVHPGALLLLDLDGFKDVNDTLGHPAGDRLLVQVADRLRLAAGETDSVARLGGDEFAVLMGGVDQETSWRTADRVIEALRRPFPLDERQVHLAASGGLLPLDPGYPDPTATLQDADLALYAAKKAGKNQVVGFRPQMRAARAQYSQLATAVRNAVCGELAVLYQPIVELSTGRPVALEALVRPESVPASQFISVAENIGLVGEIGARVLRDACRQAARWHDRYAVALSVNVSGQQLTSPGFADCVLAAVAETALPPRALILEITETVLIGAAGPAFECLSVLRQHGIRIAVDDFGTGYSSLSYLHRLPIDILKLDQAFTATLDSAGERGPAFVGAILGLGAGLGVPTVGEGVETSRQAALLRELACPLAQGYHFAAPCTAEQVTDYLAATAGAGAPLASG
jgi:diguanylate cyclase